MKRTYIRTWFVSVYQHHIEVQSVYRGEYSVGEDAMSRSDMLTLQPKVDTEQGIASHYVHAPMKYTRNFFQSSYLFMGFDNVIIAV